MKQLQEERNKLAVAAAASNEQSARIELLEKCLQQERSTSAAAAADADRNLDAAKAVVHAAGHGGRQGAQGIKPGGACGRCAPSIFRT